MMCDRALPDGIVSRLVGANPLPKFYKIRQIFDDKHISDIPAEIASQLSRAGTLDLVKNGQTIAVAVGSRGISNLSEIVRCVCSQIKTKDC